jgi:uncharacterized ferredoxin-like protein
LWFTKSSSAELQKAVKRILEARFGPQSKEVEAAVRALVERADRQEKLEKVLERVATATSLADLLADKV